MPKYTITNKGNVITCKWNCKAKHEHFAGSYESALKYFGQEPESVQAYGDLMNIIFFRQAGDAVSDRWLSNELFDHLVLQQSKRKYYAPVKDREKNAIDALNQAYEKGLIMDEKLLSWMRDHEKYVYRRRAIMYDEWLKDVDRNGWDLHY